VTQGFALLGRQRLEILSEHIRETVQRVTATAKASGGRLVLALWAVSALLITGELASAHWYALPHPPPASPQLLAALSAQLTAADGGKLSVTHVLYAQCQCSRQIVEHLVARGARHDVVERVLVVEPSSALQDRLRAAGYRVEALAPLALKRQYGIESAPLLIVADAAHVIRYMGGYTTRKQAPESHDDEIIDRVLKGDFAEELPVFGCAVTRRLQKLLDPLGLQYGANIGETR
jgi:hypothetical protein